MQSWCWKLFTEYGLGSGILTILHQNTIMMDWDTTFQLDDVEITGST